ncbi:MAG TPA: molybdopterin-binding protein [Polyangiaceae bacterium]|nr:molybdopterin-binding protein [Polyangiaceae bacterium]
MDDLPRTLPRVLVAAVTASRARAAEDAAKGAAEEIEAAKLKLVRSVVVKGEAQYIRQLVHHVSNDNEADAIIMVGGVGLGPRDVTCDALDSFFERHIEGFGDAFRQLLRDEFKVGVGALLERSSAGVYNRCLVYALPNRIAVVRKAIQVLIAPTLVEAVDLASEAVPHTARATPSAAGR